MFKSSLPAKCAHIFAKARVRNMHKYDTLQLWGRHF